MPCWDESVKNQRLKTEKLLQQLEKIPNRNELGTG
jgi:hypothetical protein